MASRTPFRVHPLKSKSQHHKYECCAVSGSTVFIGTGDGSIVKYDVQRTASGYECVGSNLAKTNAQRRPIQQLAPIPELRMMLVLCDGTIMRLDLDELDTVVGSLRGVKECTSFHLKKERGVFHLAGLTKRKTICIMEYRRDADDWTFTRELAVPDGAKSVNWTGTHILVGFKKDYCLINVVDGTIKANVPFNKGTAPLVANMDTMKEVVVAVEGNLGVRMDGETAKPTSSFAIRWPSLPSSLAYVHPYTLSVVEGTSVDIHFPFRRDTGGAADASMGSGTAAFCQTLPIKYADKISLPAVLNSDWPKPSAPNAVREVLSPVGRTELVVVTTTDNCLYLLEMTPIADQVQQLFRAAYYEEALELCRLCKNETSHLLSELRLQYANHYFGLKRFKEAFAQFEQCPADPRVVATFFPQLAISAVLNHKASLKLPPNQATAESFAKDQLDDALRGLIEFLVPQRKPPPAPRDDKDTPSFTVTLEDVANDEVHLQQAVVDTAYVHALLLTDREDEALGVLCKPNSVIFEDAEAFMRQHEEWVCLAMLFHSRQATRVALLMLRCLGDHGTATDVGRMDDALINSVGAIVFRKLVERDVAAKVTARRNIRANVEQVSEGYDEKMMTKAVNQVIGVIMTVFFLKNLRANENGDADFDTVREFAPWTLLHFPPEFTTKIFTEAVAPPKPQVVAHFLRTIPGLPPTVTAHYLERILGPRFDKQTDKDLHNQCVAALLQVIEHGREKLTYCSKLHSFLDTSQYYNPEEALTSLQASSYQDLSRQRALVYKRLGRHADAVKMFLQSKSSTSSFEQAVAYANDVSEPGTRGIVLDPKGEAYRALLETLVRPGDGSEPARTAEALELINRHPHVDVAVALEILSDTDRDVQLSQLDDFIRNSLKAKHSRLRELEVQHQILQATRRQLNVTLTRQRMVRSVIDSGTRCSVCDKLIKDTVFDRYPNGVLVHHACLLDDHVCPKTQTNFLKSLETLTTTT